MAAEVGATADPDDLLMFLDGDAFPIADVMPVVHRALDQMVLHRRPSGREQWGQAAPSVLLDDPGP